MMDAKKNWVDLHEGELFGDGGVKEQCKQCKGCMFRDKTTVRNEECGWYKCTCRIFEPPGYKPQEIHDNTGQCEYFEEAD